MDNNNTPILYVAEKLQLEDVLNEHSYQEQFDKLAHYLDHLIATDFNKLISILYRIDVSETKAKAALAAEADKFSPGQTLAKLLIERESEKIKFRELYKRK